MIRSNTCPEFQNKEQLLFIAEDATSRKWRPKTSKRRTKSSSALLAAQLPPISGKPGHSGKRRSYRRTFLRNDKQKSTSFKYVEQCLKSESASKDLYHEDHVKPESYNNFFITRDQDGALGLQQKIISPSESMSIHQLEHSLPISMLNEIKTSSSLVGLSYKNTKHKSNIISVPGGTIHNDGRRNSNGNYPPVEVLPTKHETPKNNNCFVDLINDANDESTEVKNTFSNNKINNHKNSVNKSKSVNTKSLLALEKDKHSVQKSTASPRTKSPAQLVKERWARENDISLSLQLRAEAGWIPSSSTTVSSETSPCDESQVSLVSWINPGTHKTFAFVYDEAKKKSQLMIPAPQTDGENAARSCPYAGDIPRQTTKIINLEPFDNGKTTLGGESSVQAVSLTVKNMDRFKQSESTEDNKGMRIFKWILAEQNRTMSEISQGIQSL